MDVWYDCQQVETLALDAALRAVLGEAMTGISVGAQDAEGRCLRVHYVDLPTPEQEAAALAVVAAHDPVFLSVDKTTIQADGVDEATITVRAASPVTLLVADVVVVVELENGVGEVGITSADPRTIFIRVQDADNRCAQVLEVRAV